MTTRNVVHEKLFVILVTYTNLDGTECIAQCQKILKTKKKQAFNTTEFKKQIRNRTRQDWIIFKKLE